MELLTDDGPIIKSANCWQSAYARRGAPLDEHRRFVGLGQ